MDKDKKSLDKSQIQIELRDGVCVIRVETNCDVIYIAFCIEDLKHIRQSINDGKSTKLWKSIAEKLTVSALIDLIKEVVKWFNF